MSSLIKLVVLIASFFVTITPCFADKAKQITGDNVLILFKQNDSLSKKIADYYAQQRSVPKSQLVSLKLPTLNNSTMSSSQLADIQQQLTPYLNNKIKVLLLTWHAPYRVGCMSITSAMSLGYDEKYCSHNKNHPSGCHTTANSPFFNAKSGQLWQQDSIRLSMMLSGNHFEEVKALIDRGVKSDKTQPEGDAYLVRTQDTQRSTRWRMFKSFANTWSEKNGLKIHYIDDHQRPQGTSIQNKHNILFYLTGYTQVPDINTNHYLPGAIADHLTSTGGAGISHQGQMKAFRWLEAGVTVSYGTVIEPCNYPQKFPNAQILIPSYVDGDTLIEAYWKSVQQPGEGLFVGEPLACPWCH